MQCPSCQNESPAGTKFCGECGTRLVTACAACGETNPPANRFCGQCGAPLARAAEPARLASPQDYTPERLAQKVLLSKNTIEGERKQVTVLFADLKGSMELLADRDPEHARKLLHPVIEHMMEAVHRYEGTVNNLMGDGIMALFGAPVAHEDHALRACYAALRMQQSVKEYAEAVRRTEGVPIQIRAGLNSGEVVVGSIGNDLKMDYTAVGQTVHLAARMEQMAMPGSIMITNDTLRLAEGYLQVRSLGLVNVKGMNEPIEAHEVTGAGPVRSRLQAAAAQGLTRFVGRAAEFETLCRALDKASSGHGQIVAIVGEPGVGKSRLFWELTHSRRTSDWLILASGSASYGKATAYLPVIDLLKGYFTIEERDDLRRIREKITGKLLALNKSLETTLPAFLTLFDVLAEDPSWENLDPSQRRQRTFDAVKRLLIRESQVQPLMVVFEDLHWIDSESQAILDSLVESLPGARILLLVNYRPEYQHGWGNKTYYSQLRIDPLPPESASELLQALLGSDAALAPVKRLLIERTEGNPFFLEETVRTLLETKVLTGGRGNHQIVKPLDIAQVPATVQAVLAARIDRLAAEEKGLLQSAAVIGKDVPFLLLKAVMDQPEEELRRGLARLQSAEFLYEASLFPELEYTFKHALTQEVAYGSVLQQRRHSLHGRIVEVFERLYPDRLSEHFELLAHHASRGEVWNKAVDFLHLAGKKAALRSATPEAIALLEQALEALRHLPEHRETIEKAIDIRVDLGPTLIAKSGFSAKEVEANYSRARALCERLDDPPQLFPVLWSLARMHDTRGELREGQVLAEQLLHLAARAQDPALLLEAHHELWANLAGLGELTAARLHVERGFALYDPQQHRQHAFSYGGHDPGVCSVYHAAEILWQLGYPDQALQKSRESMIMARESSHASTMFFALSFAAWFQQCRGDRQALKALVEENMALAHEHGFSPGRAQADFLKGWLFVGEGDAEAGIRQMSQVLLSQQARGTPSIRIAHCGAVLAEVLGNLRRIAEGLDVATKTLTMVRRGGGRYYEAELHRVKGELMLTQNRPDEQQAEASFRSALKVARRQSAKSLELRAAASLSRLWRRQGKHDDARQLLTGVYGWFTEGFDTADLKQAKALLDEL